MAYQHKWSFDPSLYVWSLMPMLADWLYSLAYILAGETSARLLNLSFVFLMAVQGLYITRWLGGSPKAAKLTALLFLTTPLTFAESNSLYIDATWGAFLVAGFMAILQLITKLNDRSPHITSSVDLVYPALVWGFACATKAITLVMLPIATVLLAFLIVKHRNQLVWRKLVIAIAVFLCLASVPYITSWLISGNPVFPFYNSLFKSSYYPAGDFNNPYYNSGLAWNTLYLIIFNASDYLEGTTGAAGFQWILLLPVSLIMLLVDRNRRTYTVLILSIAATALVFYSQSYLRYVFPIFLLVAASISATIYPSKLSSYTGSPRLLALMVCLAISLNILFFCSAGWTYRNIPLELLFNIDKKREFIALRSPVRIAIEHINELNTSHTPVAFFTTSTFGVELKAVALYPSWHNYVFQNRISNAGTSTDVISMMSEYNSEYLVLSDLWRDEKTRKIIEDASIEITKIHHISVRKIISLKNKSDESK
jgi:hypothetical protein